jgi:hypothetical protein
LKRKHDALSGINDEVASKRVHLYADSVSSVAPSVFGRQEVYKRLNETKFAFNRPPLSETVPLAILHPIFGEFVQEAGTYQPTATDNALVRDLRNVMSKTDDAELVYCSEFRSVLRKHYTEVQLEASQVGSTSYVSDGHITVGEFMSSVCEGKLWKGSGDPEIQAAGYLITSVRHTFKRVGDYPDVFPCMIIYIFGEYSDQLHYFVTKPCLGTFICFAGAVLTDRLHLETLTPAFPMHTNQHEGDIATQAARTLGAFRRAIAKLQRHYAGLALKNKATFTSEDYEGLIYPYRCHYFKEGSTKVDFRYVRRLHDNKLLFLCQDASSQKLCVKFTKRYSEAAHRHCANRDVAPRVYTVEPLPGGWIMVVMEYLEDDIYEPLLAPESSQAFFAPEVRRVVGVLHEGKFVHGDVRGVNLMVRRKSDMNGEGKNVLLVDFDWAGPQATTRYPPHINRDIYRPPGAIDGELITQEHDIAMVDDMFKAPPP